MPHYYFHVFDDEICIDEEGAELTDLSAARQRAVTSARSLICDSVHKGHLNLDHRIEIADEKDSRVMTVTFREAFIIQG